MLTLLWFVVVLAALVVLAYTNATGIAWTLAFAALLAFLYDPTENGCLAVASDDNSAVMSKLSTHSGTVSVTVMVPNSLGPGELLQHYGTDLQKRYYLPRLAKGLEIPCFALTNPHAGSDAAAIPDYGIVCIGEHDGNRILGLRVTWEKRYITLGPVATLLGLAIRAYDPDHLVGDQEDIGITCALIPT